VKVEIYGSSDDNLYVEGGNLTDQFSAYVGPKFLHFSDGSIFQAEYSPDNSGCWRIELVKAGAATAKRTHTGVSDDAPGGGDYTDRWTLTGGLSWVECWDAIDGPDYDTLAVMFRDGFHTNAKDREALLKAYRIVMGRELA